MNTEETKTLLRQWLRQKREQEAAKQAAKCTAQAIRHFYGSDVKMYALVHLFKVGLDD